MHYYNNFERAVARMVWEMNNRGITITEKSLADFAGRCSPPIVGEPFIEALEELQGEHLIVLSLKAGVGRYVRYVSPSITQVFGLVDIRFPTLPLP